MFKKILGILLLCVLLASCGEQPIQPPPTKTVVVIEKPEPKQLTSTQMDGADLAYEMSVKTWLTMALADYQEKYFLRNEGGTCLELQANKLGEYCSGVGCKVEGEPSDILPTPNCKDGASFKTSSKDNGYAGKSLMFSIAVRVRNKGAANFNDDAWNSMSVEEICEKSKLVGVDGDIGIDGNAPEHWLSVVCM